MTTTLPPVNNILGSYTPRVAYDEFVAATSQPHSHVRTFLDSISALGRNEVARRWNQAQHLVHENSFAYSGNATAKDTSRPWELDALPLIISSAEWMSISKALIQRARLLDLLLRDVFGEQTLISSGVLPAELVFSHPGFVRAYHGQHLPQGRFLHMYAADLVRNDDGQWCILADRTEAPSGLGYALENRIVISRMLPDVFGQCQVRRLAPFFIAAQETFRSLAPQHRDNPRLALLSHGSTSPNYFEDAYLARYLGYTLVEGGDLAVRDGPVMLKTLGGLLPVDVLLRHQNSDDCDPLELGSDPTLGVAGLTQAARTGDVAIANALGSGLVESSALMAFMPQLCQALLGENLAVPNADTWWCGQANSLEYVANHLASLHVQPAFRRRGKDGPLREALCDMPHDQLLDRIRATPEQFCAQQSVARSTAPVWRHELQPANVAIRAYVVASGDSYSIMPGALARITSSLEPLEVSIRTGEGSKDVWILSDGPVEHVTLLDGRDRTITLRRSGAELPSRVADNFFWLGRQVERAEASARLLRSAVSRMTGETRSTSDAEIPVLLRCLAEQGQIEPGYAIDEIRNQLPYIAQQLPAAVFDPNNQRSLRCVVDELYRLASILRDRMSQDTWRILYRIHESFQLQRPGTANLADLLAMADQLIIQLIAFSGIVVESMTRSQVFRFLELGRRLERSTQLIGLVRNCFIPMPDSHGPVLETVLEVDDSLMTYRSRYLANFQLAAVLDLLLTDESNPRSLAYQFVQLVDHVQQLPRDDTQPGYSQEQRITMSLLHSIRQLDIHALSESHSLGEYEPLGRIAAEWESYFPKLSEAISHRYLVHAGPAYQLADINPQ